MGKNVKMQLIEQGTFDSQRDVLKLGIIDWNRLNGYWPNMADALDTIGNSLIGRASYTVVDTDLCSAPERDDWPGWKHAGRHAELGRLWWNTFRAQCPESELRFHDEPDFSGVFRFPELPEQWFWGDIGRVSASSFSLTMKKLNAHDLWISVLNEERQVIIEPFVSIKQAWVQMFIKP